MKKALSIVLCIVMLLAAVPFTASAYERPNIGTINNFGGIILCDGLKDDAYSKYGKVTKINVGGDKDNPSNATAYWLFSEDYSVLNVLVEVEDYIADDQQYYDEDGNEIRVFNDYWKDDRTDFDNSLYEWDPQTGRMTSPVKPYPTAMEAARYDDGHLYWHTDGIELWVNPTNNLHLDGGSSDTVEQGYHYKVDLGGHKYCFMYSSMFRWNEDCESQNLFDAKVNIYERDEKSGHIRYYAEFAIYTHFFSDKIIPKMNDDGTIGTTKRSKSKWLATMEEGKEIGIGCMLVDDTWKVASATIGDVSRAAEERWTMIQTHMEGTNPVVFAYLLENQPSVTLGKTVQNSDCESIGKEHEWIDRSVAPTCTEAGVEKTVCRFCGKTNEKPLDPDPSLHVVDLANPKEVTQDPACLAAGKGICVCSACGQDVEVELPALGHNFGGEYESDENGHWQRCQRCGDPGEVTAHNLGEVDCTKDAVCTDCAYVVPAGHDFEATPAQAATFEQEGTNGYLTCKRCGKIFTLVNPTAETTVEAEVLPKLVWDNPFKDVKTSSWFYADARFVNYYGMINGITNTTFEPNTPMTRGMLVTVLHRYEGEPEPKGKNTFSDVSDKQYYAKPIMWAAENGIVSGVGGNKFNPKGNLTREQIAKIMYGYAQLKGYDVSASVNISTYPDAKKVSSWAKEYMSWANAAGLITGTNVGGVSYLDPQGSATRAQVAAIMRRFVETVAAPAAEAPTKAEFAQRLYLLAKEFGANTERAERVTEFVDATVPAEMIPACVWLNGEGIMTADENGNFYPDRPLTPAMAQEAMSNFYYGWGNAEYVGGETLPALAYDGAYIRREDLAMQLGEFSEFCKNNFTFASYIHKGINVDRMYNGYIENVDQKTGKMPQDIYENAYSFAAGDTNPFRQIWEFGFDHLRLPTTLRDFFYKDGDGNLVPSEDAFGILDESLALAHSYGLRVVIELCEYSCYMEDEYGRKLDIRNNPEAYLDEVLEMWGYVAKRYKDTDPDLLAYEIFNEPCELFDMTKAEFFEKLNSVDEETGKPFLTEEEKAVYIPIYEELLKDYNDDDIALWNIYQKKIYELLRSVDPDKTIVLGTTNCNLIDSVKHLDISYAKDDPRKILSIHHYAPHSFTMTWFTTDKYTVAGSREALAKYIKMSQFQESEKVLIWMSEFGVWRGQDKGEAAKYYADAVKNAAKYDIAFCLWDLSPFSDAFDNETMQFHDFVNSLFAY